MTVVKINMDDMPREIGTVFENKKKNVPYKFYTDPDIIDAWGFVTDKVSTAEEMGQIEDRNVDIIISGFMPGVMRERFAAWCVRYGYRSYYRCDPDGTVRMVYDERLEA